MQTCNIFPVSKLWLIICHIPPLRHTQTTCLGRPHTVCMICTAWHRSTKSDHEDEGASDTLPLASRVGESRSHEALPRGSGTAASNVLRQKRMSFKAAGQATLGFLNARRRLEDGLKCFSKRRQSRRESLCGDSEFSMLIRFSVHLELRGLINEWRVNKNF